MTKKAPNKLTIKHLRGSVLPFVLPFESGKKLTVVYGENGSGKSTICDALEFLGKGKVGSIEKRGLGKTNRYWPTMGKKPTDISVTLETDGKNCQAIMTRNEVVVSPPDDRPHVEVLRRAQILKLIEDDPADRYEAIKRFIDVSAVEASEDSLRESIKRVKLEQAVALTRIEENRVALESFWVDAGKPGKELISWAEKESKRNTEVFEGEANSLDSLQKAYDRLKTHPLQLDSANQKLQIAIKSLAMTQEDLEKSVKGLASDSSDTVTMLESVKTFLSLHPNPAACPVCESKNKILGLSKRVDERLNSFKTLREVQTRKNKAEKDVQQARQLINTVNQECKKPAAAFEKAKIAASLPKDTSLPKNVVPLELSEWDGWLKATAKFPLAWKKAETSRRTNAKLLGILKKALIAYNDNLLTAQELQNLLPELEKVGKIVEEERHLFTSAALATIANEVGRLFEVIHPGEGLSKISMLLDPSKRASLNMGATFMGVDGTPPQAYFSDSHLDTLGLCVFLALAALDKPDETILVLDDILGSVDEPHVDRLIEMLYTEVAKFRHCIITTHYRPWKQKFRWGWLQNGQCHFVELTK